MISNNLKMLDDPNLEQEVPEYSTARRQTV